MSESLDVQEPSQQVPAEDTCEPSAAELQLQLIDQRDQFLFEYEELEDELLELKTVIATMQHTIEEADRKWAQERELKLQLERQVMESIQVGAALQMPPSPKDVWPVPDDPVEAIQPQTPPGTEDYEGKRQRLSQSGSESAVEVDSPPSCRSTRGVAETDASLALALEAQIELANLRQEHRNVISELVQAKLEIAVLRAGHEPCSHFQTASRVHAVDDRGHVEASKSHSKPAGSKPVPSRRWFSVSKLQ